MDTLTSSTLVAVIFWITFACWIAIGFWEGKGRRIQQVTATYRRNDLLCFYGVGVATIYAICCKGIYPHAHVYAGQLLFWVGIGFVWAGLLLRHWAVMTLGQYHVMTIHTEPKQPVITKGPYKYVRHPSYLGALATVFGIALALNNLSGGIVLIAIAFTALVWRIHIEDKYLMKHLGDAYRQYAQHTRRLVPCIW